MAQRCARGQDERPVIPRWQAPILSAGIEFETPLGERERLMAALTQLVSPLLADLRDSLQACGQVQLAVRFDDGGAQEKERAFLFPVSKEKRVVRALEQLLDGMHWRAAASALSVTLAQIQDVVGEQLALFPLEEKDQGKLGEVQRYLATRFAPPEKGGFEGIPLENSWGHRLRRAMLAQPGAPLPEWRVSWLDGDDL
jgi:hypothetical protein